MPQDSVKRKVHEVLKRHFPEDTVDVSSPARGRDLHVVVVSRRFDGMRMQQAQDWIDGILKEALTAEEWRRISLIIGVSPEDVKAVS